MNAGCLDDNRNRNLQIKPTGNMYLAFSIKALVVALFIYNITRFLFFKLPSKKGK